MFWYRLAVLNGSEVIYLNEFFADVFSPAIKELQSMCVFLVSSIGDSRLLGNIMWL